MFQICTTKIEINSKIIIGINSRKNKFLFSMLKDLIEKDPKVNMTVSAIEEMGWNGDAIESQDFFIYSFLK